MGLRLVCDGCEAPLPKADAAQRGRLEPVWYCRACDRSWQAFEAEQDAQRVQLVTAFEAWRAGRLAALRQRLKRVPDE